MSNKRLRFLAFLGINLLAAYAPAVLWVPGLPGSASIGWKFLFSPVLLALLMACATNPFVAWCILIAFLGRARKCRFQVYGEDRRERPSQHGYLCGGRPRRCAFSLAKIMDCRHSPGES